MKNGRILMWCAAAAVVVAGPAYAQQEKRFDIRLQAKATHDDNVSKSNAAIAALRQIEQEDWVYIPSLTVDIMQPFGRNALFLNGSTGYTFYDKNDRLNRESIGLRGGAIAALGPCGTTLAGAYSRQQSDLNDIVLGPIENTQTGTSVSLDATCGRAIGIAPNVTASHSWTDNSNALRKSSNAESTNVSVGISYRRPTFGDLTLFGSYGTTEYDRFAVAAATPEHDGFESYGAGVRYTRRIGSRIQGTVTAGYTSVQPNSATASEFNGMTYGADLTFRPSSRIEAQASFKRAVEPSNRVNVDYSVDKIYSLQGTYALGRRIKFGLGGEYRDSDYEVGAGIAGSVITDEKLKSIFANVQFDLNNRVRFIVDASQQERDANLMGFDYTANRVGLTVAATY